MGRIWGSKIEPDLIGDVCLGRCHCSHSIRCKPITPQLAGCRLGTLRRLDFDIRRRLDFGIRRRWNFGIRRRWDFGIRRLHRFPVHFTYGGWREIWALRWKGGNTS